jgi:uncharacterized protein involved in cysteine biosynthesis
MRTQTKGGLIALVLFLGFVVFKIVQTGSYTYFLPSVPSWVGNLGILIFIIALAVMSAVFYIIGALIGKLVGWMSGEEEAQEEKEAKE